GQFRTRYGSLLSDCVTKLPLWRVTCTKSPIVIHSTFPMTTSRGRADRLGTEVYSRAIDICLRLDELCKISSESGEDFKWSDSTARQAYQTLQRLMIKLRDGRLHRSISSG